MKNHSTLLTLILLFGCTTRAWDSGAELQEGDGDNVSEDEGDEDGSTAGGPSDGGTDDGGTSNSGTSDGEEGSGSDDGSGSEDGGSNGGGSSDGSGTDSVEEIAIAGSYWNSTLSASYIITSATFTENNSPPAASTYVWDLTRFSNTEQYAIGQTPAGYWAGPGWTRFDWVIEADTLHLCMTVNNAADEATALATEPADGSDLEDGCAAVVGWMPLDPM